MISNYNLSCSEIFQTIFISEYGLRHLAHAQTDEENFWIHCFIAVIELCPILGLIATAIEALASYFFKLEWLFFGTQRPGSLGPADLSMQKSIISKLNAYATPGITFKADRSVKELSGSGTCSAMVLDFAARVLKIKKNLSQSEGDRALLFWKAVAALGPQFADSNENWRIRQAAYDTIEVTQDPPIDPSRNKVQALANDHNLEIVGASQTFVTTSNNETALRPLIDQLPEGVFLLRVIEPANNHKLEISGHSLIYIKLFGLTIFYDPNFGALNLTDSPNKAEILMDNFRYDYRSFNVSHARFYQLEAAPERNFQTSLLSSDFSDEACNET